MEHETMPMFRGKLQQVQDGPSVSDNPITGQYEVHGGGMSVMTWEGSFTVPANNLLGIGEYRLILDDGRSAYIRILGITSAGGQDRAVIKFKGNGPPPS
jgi:hypothetical protein